MGHSNILSINRPDRQQFSNTRLLKRRNSEARILDFEDMTIYRNTTIPIIGENTIDLLSLPSIDFIQAFGDKSIFYCIDGKKVWSSETIYHWMKKIDKKYFIQTHNAYFVNVRSINGIDWANNQILVGKIGVPMNNEFHEGIRSTIANM